MTAKKVGKLMGRVRGDKVYRPMRGSLRKPAQVSHKRKVMVRKIFEDNVIKRIGKGESVEVLYSFCADKTRVIEILRKLPRGFILGAGIHYY